jgi:hypothetical protein
VAKKRLKAFFEGLDYSLFNNTNGLDYFPQIDITKNYHGDILTVPR